MIYVVFSQCCAAMSVGYLVGRAPPPGWVMDASGASSMCQGELAPTGWLSRQGYGLKLAAVQAQA